MTKKDLKKTAQAIKFLFSALDSNPGKLLARLKEENFASTVINIAEEAAENAKTIEKYRNLIETLVYSARAQQSQAILFAIANRFYEYCFSSSSFEEFSTYIKNPGYYPIARMVYANTWYNLSSIGWQIWHKNTLTALRKQYEKGKEIVYIAGGTDIYQLLQNGIFLIRVIDPIFPSQTTYYSEGWEFLIKGNTPDGGLGDTITMDYKEEKLILKRTSYAENGSFKTPELSDNRMLTIPKSTTIWTIYNEQKKILGTYTLERRFVEQNDFKVQKKRIFLISFNELYFVTSSSKINWGIDVRNFDPEITIYVKQLRKPVSRPMLINFRKAEDYPFSFIQLGTKIN